MITPLPGYVLIEPIEEEQMTAGGIAIPETSKDKPMRGKVIDARSFHPDDKEHRAWHDEVIVGLVVIYKKWTNQEVEKDGKKYLLVSFGELLAIDE